MFRGFYGLEASRYVSGDGLGLALVGAIANLRGAISSFLTTHPTACARCLGLAKRLLLQSEQRNFTEARVEPEMADLSCHADCRWHGRRVDQR